MVVTDYTWDKFGGRILGKVSIGGNDVATTLINANLAIPYYGTKKTHSWCE